MNEILPSNRSSLLVLLAICMLFGAAGLLRLNDLSLYTPDSTRYMIWGNSLAHGKGFLDDTQPDPDRFVLHAPFYSILIAPVEYLFPLSLPAVKVYTLLLGIVALSLFWYWLRQLLKNDLYTLAGTILLACNPLFLVYSTEVLSEAPFIAAILFIFILIEKSTAIGAIPFPQLLGWIVAIGAVGLLREVGVALVAAAAIFLVTTKRFKVVLFILLAAGISIGGWYLRNQILVGPPAGSQRGNVSLAVQHILTPEDASLATELLARAWLSLKAYSGQIGGMIFYPLFGTHQVNLIAEPIRFPFVVEFLVLLVVGGSILTGIVRDVQSSGTAVPRILFVLFYLLLILIYPVHDVRFLIPILPILIYYSLVGLAFFATTRLPQASFSVARIAPFVVALCMLPNAYLISAIIRMNQAYVASPTGMYEEMQQKSALNTTMYTQPWTLLGEWIRQHLPEGITFASPAKELAVVVGDRKVMELDPGLTLPIFEKLLRENNVQYLLAPMRWREMKVYEFLMAESRRFWFEPIYKVSSLQVMKVHSRFLEPKGDIPLVAIDTTNPMGLLKQGRAYILSEQYGEAIRVLTRGVEAVPNQSELVYQTIVAYALSGDSVNAQRYYHQLLALPQVASYIFLSRLQLHQMNLLDAAEEAKNPEEQAINLSAVALDYWRQGYYLRGARLANEALAVDSTYFVGLLWGFVFNHQNGDRAYAERYLHQLRTLDDTNQIVRSFVQLLAIDDSIRVSGDSAERSRLRYSSAQIYRTIELFDEAFDEAEKSLNENPQNSEARMLLAQSFAQRGRRGRAEQYYESILSYDSLYAPALRALEARSPR